MVSEAPLEIIRAQSNHLKGVFDSDNKSFAWTVEVKSFEGFNSPLQREHFNENYLETAQYPRASFQGKIIEDIDLLRDGMHTVRAKGILNVHGVQRERIVKGQLEKKGNNLRIKAQFTVPLADHDIEIPRVVFQKIAEEITVTVDAQFSQKGR